MSYSWNAGAMHLNTADDYFINADSFGSELPDNWEEIAEAMNAEIEEKFKDVLEAREKYNADSNTENENALNEAAVSFLYWLDDFWDHIFWDEHPEYVE